MSRVRRAGEPRGALRLAFDPVFGAFFWGKVVAISGVWIHNVVAAVVAYQISGSSLAVGAVIAVQFGPQLVLTPISGVLTDRGNPAVQIIVGRLVMTGGSALLAAVVLFEGGVAEMSSVIPVVVCSGICGIGTVVGSPAMQSIVPSLVKPSELPAAVALNSLPMSLARAVGPALGAFVSVALGPAAALLMAAGAGLVFVAVIVATRLPQRQSGRTKGIDFSLGAAWRYLRSDRRLTLALVGVTAVGIGADPALTLAPMTADLLGEGAEGAGWILSAFGVGAGLAYLVIGVAQRRYGVRLVGSLGLAAMALATAATAVAGSIALAVVLFALCGAGMSIAISSLTTIVQQHSPSDLRGRIMAFWLVAFIGPRPLVAAVNGAIADHISLAAAYVACGLLVLVAAVAVGRRPRGSREIVSEESPRRAE